MIRIMSVAAVCAALAGCVHEPKDPVEKQYMDACMQTPANALLMAGTLGLSIAVTAPPCLSEAKRETAAYNQQQIAAVQAAEAQKQAAIQVAGGIQKYNEQIERRNEEDRAAAFNAQMSFCLGQQPTPSTAYQDQWEQNHCRAYAEQIMDGPIAAGN